MRRSVALVAAAVTTFSLVMLVSVVYAYRGLAAGPSSLPTGNDPSVKTVEIGSGAPVSGTSAGVQPSLAQTPSLSVQEAASIAGQFIHATDLYSAALSTYNGMPAFKIAFSSGELVYVSMNGVVLGVVPPPSYATVPSSGGSGGRSFSSGSHSGGEHEGGAEHEGGDDGGSGD